MKPQKERSDGVGPDRIGVPALEDEITRLLEGLDPYFSVKFVDVSSSCKRECFMLSSVVWSYVSGDIFRRELV